MNDTAHLRAELAQGNDCLSRLEAALDDPAMHRSHYAVLTPEATERLIATESERCSYIDDELALIALEPATPLGGADELALCDAIGALLYQPGDAFGKRENGSYVVALPWTRSSQHITASFAAAAVHALPQYEWRVGDTTLTQPSSTIPEILCSPTPNRMRAVTPDAYNGRGR